MARPPELACKMNRKGNVSIQYFEYDLATKEGNSRLGVTVTHGNYYLFCAAAADLCSRRSLLVLSRSAAL